MSREEQNKLRDDLFCKFCGKQCKNLNSLCQHSTRCKNNPNRKDFDNLGKYSTSIKGKTQYDDIRIFNSAQALRDKYANGYISPHRGKKVEFEYLYLEHNNLEIKKWLDYIKASNFNIPKLNIIKYTDGYAILSKSQYIIDNTVRYIFEHDYLANILLNGNLISTNTVHHIDGDKTNNDIFNLMIFDTNANHKRFHNSKYAYLTYNEETHLFSCKLIKD